MHRLENRELEPLEIIEIQTGNYSNTSLLPNEAVRIFTGAPIPPDADTVVMQEKIIKDGNIIFIFEAHIFWIEISNFE